MYSMYGFECHELKHRHVLRQHKVNSLISFNLLECAKYGKKNYI